MTKLERNFDESGHRHRDGEMVDVAIIIVASRTPCYVEAGGARMPRKMTHDSSNTYNVPLAAHSRVYEQSLRLKTSIPFDVCRAPMPGKGLCLALLGFVEFGSFLFSRFVPSRLQLHP